MSNEYRPGLTADDIGMILNAVDDMIDNIDQLYLTREDSDEALDQALKLQRKLTRFYQAEVVPH